MEINLSDAGRERLIQAALGLTLGEAENVFAKIVVQGERLKPAKTSMKSSPKNNRSFARAACSSTYAASENFDQVGGLKALKGWLNKRAVAFSSGPAHSACLRPGAS